MALKDTLLFEFDTLGEIMESMPSAAEAASLEGLAELLWGQASVVSRQSSVIGTDN